MSGQAAAQPRRLGALDAARGVMLIASVSAEAVLDPRAPHFVHTKWIGLHYYDWIFPLFIVLSGAGMAFAFRSGVRWRRNLRRVLVLIVAGLAYNYVAAPDRGWADLRFTGVLQMYAALVALVALLHLVLRKPWHWAVFTLAWAGGLTYYWQRVGQGCADGIPQPTCNPTLDIDAAIFGMNHLYREGARGFETEGVLGILGALVIASAGATAGHLLRAPGVRHRFLSVVAWAAVCLLAGLGMGHFVPALKWLWTPTYGLITGAAGLALLALFYGLVDGGPAAKAMAKVTYPLRALGRNSLLVYFGSHAAMMVLNRVGDPSVPERWAAQLAWTGYPRVGLLCGLGAGVVGDRPGAGLAQGLCARVTAARVGAVQGC